MPSSISGRLLSLFALALAAPTFVAGCSSKSSSMPADASGGDAAVALCPVEPELISDFTLDTGVKPFDGRQGGWYTYGDKNGFGELDPIEGRGTTPDTTQGNNACSGPGSFHVTAKKFTDWGAALGTDFKLPAARDGGGTGKGTYDASKYKGIAFWAKASAPIKLMQVKFLDPYTEIPSILPIEQQCDYNPNLPINCSPYLVKFGYGRVGDDLAAAMQDFPKYVDYVVDTTWKRFEILFADAKQDRFNPGQKSPGDKLDLTHLEGMAIQVNTDRADGGRMANDFEIWIDDVGFIK
ncbi:MAG: hypothetical protein ABUS79_14765 [Pseudomonadota bacterium]